MTEEVSRTGRREADIEHLFLALVISEQSAGRALRSLGIDLEAARHAVERQHQAQLASIGIEASFPESGSIVFHETGGYEWSKRAVDLITKAGGKGKAGDAAAVLRELLAEPSGMVEDILEQLDTTPDALLERLNQLDETPDETLHHVSSGQKGRASVTVETFVTAPIDEVQALLSDPACVPEWEPGIGSIDLTQQHQTADTVWEGAAVTHHPDGKSVKIKPQYRKRSVELVSAGPRSITWRFGFPDTQQNTLILSEFSLAPTTGGTQVRIRRSWSRRHGWRRLAGIPLLPFQKFLMWISLFQTGSAISRAFR